MKEKQIPSISLILTVRNDAKLLQRTIKAIDRLTDQPNEILVAVADSTDETLHIAESWAQTKKTVRILKVGKANRSQGRNLAAQEATGGILVFTDAGCLPQAQWLSELVAPFSHPDIELTAGLTVGHGLDAWSQAQVPFVLVPADKVSEHPLPSTRNMAIRAVTFHQQTGFREDLNYAEDYEFARRLAKANIMSTFCPQSKIEWIPRANPVQYFSMILHLTQGDMLAGTWRVGHISMWARYVVFIFLWAGNLSLGTVIFIFYLVLKLLQLKPTLKTLLWTTLLIPVTDLAVLTGTLSGLFARIRNNT